MAWNAKFSGLNAKGLTYNRAADQFRGQLAQRTATGQAPENAYDRVFRLYNDYRKSGRYGTALNEEAHTRIFADALRTVHGEMQRKGQDWSQSGFGGWDPARGYHGQGPGTSASQQPAVAAPVSLVQRYTGAPPAAVPVPLAQQYTGAPPAAAPVPTGPAYRQSDLSRRYFGELEGTGDLLYRDRPELAWARIADVEAPGENPYGQYFRAQHGKTWGRYINANLGNPSLRWTDYAPQVAQGLRQQWAMLPAEERGERNTFMPAGRFLG